MWQEAKQIFESTHIWFKYRYLNASREWEGREGKTGLWRGSFDPPVTSSLTYPYLDRKGSFLGCFEVISPYLNVVSIMNYQTKRGGKALIYSFLLQLCMMCFHWRLWKVFHHASHPEVVKGQNQKELTLSFLLWAQTPCQWLQGKAFEADKAKEGLSISIILLTCIRVVSPVQNGEMIFMLMVTGRFERGNR